MAQATSYRHDKVVVYLGNDATPTVYTAPCGFTDKAVRFEKEMATTPIPDCADLSKSDWNEHDPVSRGIAISGQGVLAEEMLEDWLDAWHSDDPVPAKIDFIGESDIITYTGLIHITTLSVDAAKTEGRARISVELASHGAMAKTKEAVPE